MSEHDFTVESHFGLGGLLRNEWNLWNETNDLTRWFAEMGIDDADDRSAIICTVFYRTIMAQNIALRELLENYRDFLEGEK
nr:DUF6794 domain-containing protein [Pedobacter sp. SYSU D00535]